MDSNDAAERRRIQNRDAQRRFRWKTGAHAGVSSSGAVREGRVASAGPGHATVPLPARTKKRRLYTEAPASLATPISASGSMVSYTIPPLAAGGQPALLSPRPGTIVPNNAAPFLDGEAIEAFEDSRPADLNGYADAFGPSYMWCNSDQNNNEFPSDTISETSDQIQTRGEHASLPTPASEVSNSGRFQTSLHIAAENGHAVLIAIIISNGITVDEPDSEGNTALHRATQRQRLAVVERLLDLRANPNATNLASWSPVHVAIETGAVDILTALVSRGGDVSKKVNCD
ncbi:ankyrin repeat-containing domain protein [Astrocystis sublimbata]|nr:ankyrin repeat-containing domain protein [Astrocystis sublimbata]